MMRVFCEHGEHAETCPSCAVIVERDAYRSALCDLVAAAHPYRTYTQLRAAFDKARKLLKDGPTVPTGGPAETGTGE